MHMANAPVPFDYEEHKGDRAADDFAVDDVDFDQFA